jgi:hypothetical protein
LIDTALLDELEGKKPAPVDYIVPDANTTPVSSINYALLDSIESGQHQDIIDNTAKAVNEPNIISAPKSSINYDLLNYLEQGTQTQSILNQEAGGLSNQLLAKASRPKSIYLPTQLNSYQPRSIRR